MSSTSCARCASTFSGHLREVHGHAPGPIVNFNVCLAAYQSGGDRKLIHLGIQKRFDRVEKVPVRLLREAERCPFWSGGILAPWGNIYARIQGSFQRLLSGVSAAAEANQTATRSPSWWDEARTSLSGAPRGSWRRLALAKARTGEGSPPSRSSCPRTLLVVSLVWHGLR